MRQFLRANLIILSTVLLFYFYSNVSYAIKEVITEKNDMFEAADIKNGKDIALMCAACHSFKKGEPHKIGPNLFGVFGSSIARLKNYKYSSSLEKIKNKKWTLENLDKWIRDPSGFAPGNRMSFEGLIDPQDRMDVIAYLKSFR